ncbi:hypothetical protein [Nocardioides sp.]|uniref:hypothetical protein n=1 Tax=Nocardioides sp. TaxID=35761 RepID=UPI003514BE7A
MGLAVVLGIAVGGGEDDADPVDTSTLDTAFLTGALTAAERETGGRALEVSISDYSLVVRSAPLPVGSVGSIGSVGSVGAAPSAEPPAQPSAEPSEAAPDAPRVVREFSVGPGDPGYRVYVSPVGDYVPPALELDDLDLDRIVREVRAGLRAVDGVEYFTARVALEFDSADASVRQLELTTIVRGSDERLERTLVLTGPNAGERSQERSEVD